MAENSPTDILLYATAALGRATQQIEESHRSITQYLGLHPDDDKAVGQSVRAKLAPYFDPHNQRAIVIQLAAQDASREIGFFLVTSTNVLGKYLAAFRAAEQRAKELTAAGAVVLAELRNAMDRTDLVRLRILASALDGSSLQDSRDAVDALMNEGTELQQQQALLLVHGLVVCQTLAKAMQTIDVLFRHRAHVLAQFLETAPAGTVPSTLRALADEMANEGLMTIAEHLLIEMIGAVPGANIVMSAARITLDLTNKVQQIKNRHKRGDVDDMLDLSTDMIAVRTALDVATTLFDKVVELANARLVP